MQSKPVRDRRTLIAYAQIAAWSWFIYSFGPTSALLRDEQGTTKSVAGLHGTLLALGGIVGGLIATALVRRWGRGVVIRASAAFSVVGMALYVWPGAGIAMTFPGMFIVGFASGGLLIVLVNAFIVERQGASGPAALTEANALGAFAGLLAPLAVGLGAATFLTWRLGPWIALLGMIAIELWRGRDTHGFDGSAPRPGHTARPPLPRTVFWALAALVCFMSSEFSITFWGADLLRERHAFAPALAAASLSAALAGMFVGRVLGAHLARWRNTEHLVLASVAITLVGFAVTWLSPWGWVAVIGLAVTGVGLSVQFPLGLARAMRASLGQNDRVSALSAVWGSLGIAIAPLLLGAIADAVGIHAAFLLVPVLMTTAAAMVLLRPIPAVIAGPSATEPSGADRPARSR